jgi:hypothetical protein
MHHVSGATHTENINPTETQIYQIRPANTNVLRKYICNGKEITENGTYSCGEFIVKDVVNCVNPTTISDFNTMSGNPWFNVSIQYRFIENTCTINQRLKLYTPLPLSYYGATQPLGLYGSGNYAGLHAMITIPKVKSITNGNVTTDWKYPVDVNNSEIASTNFKATSDYLVDENDIPDRTVQYLLDTNNSKKLIGFASGYSLIGSSTTKQKRRANIGNNCWCISLDMAANWNKTYFRAIAFDEPNYGLLPANYVADYTYYESYFNPEEGDALTYWYKDGENVVVYIHTYTSADSCCIKLPEIVDGKIASVVEKTNNVQLLTDTVINNELFIKVTSNDAGYIVLKL